MRVLTCILILASLSQIGNAQNGIIVHPERSDDAMLLWAQNNLPCAITLSATSPDTTYKAFIPKNKKKKLAEWSDPPKDIITEIKETFTYRYILGDPNAHHDDSYRYNLPFPKGEAYMLTQGNNTEYTHNTPTTKYAYDFAMPEGSYVAAARGGVVGLVVERHKTGGEKPSLKTKGNQIMVCHDDGSIAAYAHLQYQGAIVEVGDHVFAGQVIGLSGNTGYSTSPHLHFTVLIGNRSIPIRFRNLHGKLIEGQIYKHK